jgi:hypothetical protein
MNALTISIPKDTMAVPLDMPSGWLAWPPYVVYSLSPSEHVMLSLLIDSLDDPGFFWSPNTFDLNGMKAWRVVSGPYVRINIKLPKTKDCPYNLYALVVFARGDAEAERAVLSIRPRRPLALCREAIP